MTIDEAIEYEKKLAKEIYVEAMLCHANPADDKLDDCIENGKYHEQIVEWLEELKAIKNGGISDDVCKWRLCDEESNVYDTTCRNPHILIEGTPRENNYSYCPYCGKKIEVME